MEVEKNIVSMGRVIIGRGVVKRLFCRKMWKIYTWSSNQNLREGCSVRETYYVITLDDHVKDSSLGGVPWNKWYL
jgi:hypothetical protein